MDANSLNDAAAISANDVWAVGSYGTPFEHWDGTSWTLASAPNPVSGTQLFGVTDVASNDVWAVGAVPNSQSFNQAVAEHWDGSRWSVVGGTTLGTGSKLNDVTALGANDVWAVGSYFSAATNNWDQPLVEHWDGTAWHVVASPSIGTSSVLYEVAAVASNDIWAVGSTYATRSETLVLHWDGISWRRVPSPNVGPYGNGLSGLTAVSANDIWAVGESNNSSTTLTLHWNGSTWSVVPSPNSTNKWNVLAGVSAASARDIWAVGYSQYDVPVGEDFEYHQVALLMHWDGAAWRLVASAAPNITDNVRSGVDTLANGDAWVVGWRSAAEPPYQRTLIERYACR